MSADDGSQFGCYNPLGHASVSITLNIYGHVMPGNQKRAAERFASLIGRGRS